MNLPLRLAIIGCGAVTENSHLPAVLKDKNLRLAILVDKNISRAKILATLYYVPLVGQDYMRAAEEKSFDAAIIALPHYLHAPVSIDLLSRGIHVLVEKPMAVSIAECDAMIRAAEQGKAVLAVNLPRRFKRGFLFLKEIIKSGLIGEIKNFDIREGVIYNWPVASGFFFRKEEAGGGVLIDTGAHVLDSLFWWLSDVSSFDYYDDNMGGIEANCELHLIMKSGAKGVVELSRMRMLRNTILINSERANLEVHCYSNQVKLSIFGADSSIIGNAILNSNPSHLRESGQSLFSEVLKNWVNAIYSGAELYVSPKEARKSIELIEACYTKRKQLISPWMNSTNSADKMNGLETKY